MIPFLIESTQCILHFTIMINLQLVMVMQMSQIMLTGKPEIRNIKMDLKIPIQAGGGHLQILVYLSVVSFISSLVYLYICEYTFMFSSKTGK